MRVFWYLFVFCLFLFCFFFVFILKELTSLQGHNTDSLNSKDWGIWLLVTKKCYPSLVLVQPRKNRPCLTESLMVGHKESNKTKKKEVFEGIYRIWTC